MSDSSTPIFVFACDSRGNNFNQYQQCQDIPINYIIRRGSDISQLQLETLEFLRSLSVSHDTPVIVKIAAGINDILNTISAAQTFTADSILLKLENFRKCVLSVIPWALVGFVTIPTVEVSLLPRLVNSPLPSLQSLVNDAINFLNIKIRSSNSLAGCWTVSWHLLVQKKICKRPGKGRKAKSVYRYIYSNLYDGLHGNSQTKKKWFQMLVKCFTGEALYVKRDISSSNTCMFEDITSSEHESDFKIDTDSESASVSIGNACCQLSDSDTGSDSVYIPWKRRH